MFYFKKIFIFFVTILSLAGYGYLAFAVINPGDTLDPVTSNPIECPTGPTDPTCIVTFPSSGLSLIGSTSGILSNPSAGITTETWLGAGAGQDSLSTDNTLFLGIDAGRDATNQVRSIFIGTDAGRNAIDGEYNIYIGDGAGEGNSGVSNDIIIGRGAGTNLSPFLPADNSVFIGSFAGVNANASENAVFIGNQAGNNANGGENSIFIGMNAGKDTLGVIHSNFFGTNAGVNTLNILSSNFFGQNAGYEATNASQSNFIGEQAGQSAANASNSNFLGSSSGLGANNAFNSNFLGTNAGNGASGASNSNFLGNGAGLNASNAFNSNFLGRESGSNATNASLSNFIGLSAGDSATNASSSNFFGNGAGARATNASNSFFVGQSSGRYETLPFVRGTPNAANSIFIGSEAGFTVDDSNLNNTTDPNNFSILFGNFTSTGGFENSIALGQRATNTASNQFMIGSPTRPISETVIVLDSIGGECIIDNGGANCSSDESLKSNIQPLDTTLETLRNIIPVTYTWNANNQSTIGFSAQNIQTYYPELVKEGSQGYLITNYANLVPILTKAIQELDVKLSIIESQTIAQGGFTIDSLFDSIRTWLGDVGNGIEKIFARQVVTDELCIEDICFTKDEAVQLRELIDNGSVVIPESQIETEDTNNQNDDLYEIPEIEEVGESEFIPDEQIVQE